MTTRTTMILALGLCLAGAAVAGAQPPPVTKSASVTGTATIQAIDSTTRTITLRNDKGEEDAFIVGPEVKRFNELKVGDKVKMTYYESLVLQVLKPGEKFDKASTDAAVSRAKSALPSGTVSMQDKLTVTVKAIDPAVPSITVTTADGRTVTRKIENKKNIEGIKVGDQIGITYTRALVTSIEAAK